VPLVYADDAGTRTGQMVQYCLGYLKPDTEPLEAGCHRSAQIM